MDIRSIRDSIRASFTTTVVENMDDDKSGTNTKTSGGGNGATGVSFLDDDKTMTYIIPRISESRLAQCFYRASEIARFRYQAFLAARFSAAAFESGDCDDFDDLFESSPSTANSSCSSEQQPRLENKAKQFDILEEQFDSSTSSNSDDEDLPIDPATSTPIVSEALPVSPRRSPQQQGRRRSSTRERRSDIEAAAAATAASNDENILLSPRSRSKRERRESKSTSPNNSSPSRSGTPRSRRPVRSANGAMNLLPTMPAI